MKKILISSVVVVLVFSGCSAVMPYKDNFSCINKVGGKCGSMSDIYEETLFSKDENSSIKIDTTIVEDNKTIAETEVFTSALLSEFDFKDEIPLYQKPKIAKMIVPSYIDEDGDWNKKREIYLKIEKAKFVLPNNQFSIHKK